MDPEITPEAVAETPPEQDEFAAAFAALTDPVPAAPVASTETPATPPADGTSASPAAAETPPAASSTETPPPADDTPPPDPMAELEALRAENAALKAAPPLAAAESPQPAAAPAASVAPLYTADEQSVLDKYAVDWPEVAQAEELRRRAEYRSLVTYIFDQVQKTYGHVAEYVDSRSSKDQYAEIKGLVPDYDTVRDPAIAWVKSQPAYLRTAYEAVVDSGTPEEVADLIARFRNETGVAPAPVAAPAPRAGMSAPAISAQQVAAKQAAAGLRVVSSKRTEQVAGADPNDFDGAFAEFSAAARK